MAAGVIFDGTVQEVSKRHEIFHVHDNAGGVLQARGDERPDFGARMGKSEGGEVIGHEREVKYPAAKRFSSAIQVNCGDLNGLSHRILQRRAV